MELADRIGPEETIEAQAAFHNDPYALFFSGKAGDLAVTDSQFVHKSGGTINTIPFDTVGSIEFHEPRMPRTYLFIGLGLLGYALVTNGPYATLSWVVGPVLLLTAYWLRTSRLTIYTPSRNYELRSRDDALVDVVEAYQAHQSVDATE